MLGLYILWRGSCLYSGLSVPLPLFAMGLRKVRNSREESRALEEVQEARPHLRKVGLVCHHSVLCALEREMAFG